MKIIAQDRKSLKFITTRIREPSEATKSVDFGSERNYKSICIGTTLLIVVFVLRFNSGVYRKDEGSNPMKNKVSLSHWRAAINSSHSFFPPRHRKDVHRSSSFSQFARQFGLPSHFRVIDESNFSDIKSLHYSKINNIKINNNNNHYQYNKDNINDNNNNHYFHNKQYESFNCTASKTTPSFTICVYRPEVDKFISGALLSSGIWEPFITSAFQAALDRHPDAIVVDIGANIGYYSLLASSKNHDVIAVEPNNENQRRLVAGVSLTTRQHAIDDDGDGSGTGRLLLLGNALSNGHRFVSLSSSEDNQGALRVLEGCPIGGAGILGFIGRIYSPSDTSISDTPDKGDTQTRSCDIPTLTMDDLLLVINKGKAVIKMDIEGYECRAMGQSVRFLRTIQVPYIFTEWRLMRERQYDRDTACPTHSMRRLSSTLADLGYVPHEVQSGIRLNPYNSPQWQVGDVYWRQNDQPLLVPSM